MHLQYIDKDLDQYGIDQNLDPACQLITDPPGPDLQHWLWEERVLGGLEDKQVRVRYPIWTLYRMWLDFDGEHAQMTAHQRQTT